MHGFPDFDTDVRRPFAVDEQCYDCSEFYAGCNARPSNPPPLCRDFLRLPDVIGVRRTVQTPRVSRQTEGSDRH